MNNQFYFVIKIVIMFGILLKNPVQQILIAPDIFCGMAI